MLKVGLIGAGYLGKIHLSLLTQMTEIDFIGFYDANTTNSEALNEQYGTTAYAKVDDLINSCDALVVVTPTSTHYEYAVSLIQKGKHIFIEKPVTAHLDEAVHLKKLLNNTPVCLQIGMVERFNPAFLAALPHLHEVKKIFCSRLAPFTPRGADVSVVFDVMIHDIDMVLSLVKSPIKQVKAQGEKIISTTYDMATAEVEFENGTRVYFTASRMAERKYRLVELIGTKHLVRVDFLNKTTYQFELDKDAEISVEQAYLSGNMGLLKQKEMEVKDANAIGGELKSFVDSVVNNKKVVVSLDDGIGAMELAGKIEEELNHQKK